jgi:hypothetical protein
VSKVLVIHDGKRERELLLVERLVIGRDPACDVSVDDGLLSRRHAEFVAAPTAVTVRDLGSRNGIFVNGTRRAEQALKPGDVVQIGPLRVRYLRDRAAVPGAVTPVDADGTHMIPAGSPSAPLLPQSPPAAAAVVPTAFTDIDLDEALEGETRFVTAASLGVPDNDVTGVLPPPTPRPAAAPFAMPLVAHNRPTPPVALPVAMSSVPSPERIGPFVLIHLGSLAAIVFVATIAPIVVSRGTVLGAIAEGRTTALLVWPIMPLVIAFAATLVIAHLVNRRMLVALGTSRASGEGR